VLTAAAVLPFAREEVEVAVLEIGMGGRLDATNVTDPICSAIVTVDRDHEAYLGTTLAQIAREKAGVLRGGRVTVIGPLSDEAREAVELEAAAVGARLVDASRDTVVVAERGGKDLVTVRTPAAAHRGLRPLPGAHQRSN